MSFRIIISDDLRKTLVILKRKDKTMFEMIEKKIVQIASLDSVSIQHFKNLRSPLSDFKRIHLGSFVFYSVFKRVISFLIRLNITIKFINEDDEKRIDSLLLTSEIVNHRVFIYKKS